MRSSDSAFCGGRAALLVTERVKRGIIVEKEEYDAEKEIARRVSLLLVVSIESSPPPRLLSPKAEAQGGAKLLHPRANAFALNISICSTSVPRGGGQALPRRSAATNTIPPRGFRDQNEGALRGGYRFLTINV